jgi:hypothetical protein
MAKTKDIRGRLIKLDDTRLVFVGQSATAPGNSFIAFRNKDGEDTKLVLSIEAAHALFSLLDGPIGGSDEWPQSSKSGWRIATDAEADA